ncbi:cation:proton antiporter [Algicella marina]|uniref:Potassium transporter n=1 Tax=Algicella marina TaxID=2683284 RepID=A0A6P1T3L7_9RHOB|nr:cation:proton antiporter [Algicella marina]QHQ35879.1 potassium transporter [Algicella marina]
MENLLLQATIYLAAAVVAVPVANRLGLGSVLGYLIAGIVIGPLLGVVGAETQDLQHYAEFGVVMMLFLIGLELEPRALWAMRTRLIGLGGLQIVLTAGAVWALAWTLGISWSIGLAIGLVLALSSTAIVMQTLTEKGMTSSEGGRSAFSVLLSQDIAVIPMLALIPLLALPELVAHGEGPTMVVGEHGTVEADAGHGAEGDGHGSMNLLEGLPAWMVTGIVLGSVIVIVLGGHYLTRPVFRFIAHAKLQEIFTAAALLLIIGVALLMTVVGLSPALGTFLAGVVLANSEYKHELEANLEPFKGLLLGLFFITVGAGINFTLLFADFFVILGLTLALMALKFVILFGLGFVFRIRGQARWLYALSLAQAGEFGFVLLSFTTQNGVIPGEIAESLLLIVALSMLFTPGLFIFYDRVIARRITVEIPEDDEIQETGTVIIAGLGRFGQIVNRILLSQGHKTVVIDYHNDLVAGLRKFGVEGYFGDPSRPEMLLAAGIREASVLVVSLDDRQKAVEMVRHVSREHPHVKIVARAYDRIHTFELYAAGARDIVRETFDSSVRAGKYALLALGHHPFQVEKAARVYVKQDRAHLEELARVWDPERNPTENEAYVARARQINAELNAAMKGMRTEFHDRTERGWTPPPKGGRVREDVEREPRKGEQEAETDVETTGGID